MDVVIVYEHPAIALTPMDQILDEFALRVLSQIDLACGGDGLVTEESKLNFCRGYWSMERDTCQS